MSAPTPQQAQQVQRAGRAMPYGMVRKVAEPAQVELVRAVLVLVREAGVAVDILGSQDAERWKRVELALEGIKITIEAGSEVRQPRVVAAGAARPRSADLSTSDEVGWLEMTNDKAKDVDGEVCPGSGEGGRARLTGLWCSGHLSRSARGVRKQIQERAALCKGLV